MKKLLVALCVTCVLTLAVNAEDKDAKKGQKLTPEQNAVRKEVLQKYDANKDGKLDKEERAKISGEDKEKLEKAGLGPKKKESK